MWLILSNATNLLVFSWHFLLFNEKKKDPLILLLFSIVLNYVTDLATTAALDI